jgi:hypothetical protein
LATGGEPGGSAREKIGSGYEFKHFEMRNAFIHDRWFVEFAAGRKERM